MRWSFLSGRMLQVGAGRGVLQKESPTLNKKAHVWRWKRGSFSCKHIKMTTVFCGHRSLEHTVPFVVSADVTLALPVPVTVTLFTTQQTGRQREVHHSEHLCVCASSTFDICVCVCMYIYIYISAWYNCASLTGCKPPGYLLHVCFVLCLCRDFVDWLEKGCM